MANPTDNTTTITPDNHQETLTAFKAVVSSRRSVRKFTDTRIPDEVLDECLDMAMLAPNSSNLQPWQFLIIESPVLRAKANKICMGQNAAKSADRLIAVVARTDTWQQNAKKNISEFPDATVPKKIKDYYGKLIPIQFTRGAFNVLSPAKWAVTQAYRQVKGPIASPYYDENDLKVWAMTSTALAAQNLMLALRAHGFDSCAMGGFDEGMMKELLNLGKHQHICMMIGAGERHPKGIYSHQYRFDRQNFIKTV